MSQDETFKKAIRLPHAIALVVGTIIGASIFVQPSEIIGQVPSIEGALGVWLVCGILTLFGALVCAELASIFVKTGGVYIYLKEAFSPALSFLWGWAMFWVMHSGIIAAIAVIFARYTAYFLPLGDHGIRITAIIVILIHSAINYIGVKQGSTLQMVFTIAKVGAILLIIAIGFIWGSSLPGHFELGTLESGQLSTGNFLTALIAGLFAFGGWHMVTYNSEETVNSQKTIPRALIGGTVIVTLCYIALNTVYFYVLPLDVVANSTRVAADAADALAGSGGAAFMAGLVMFSTFGALAGIVLCGPRVYYSMAQDGLLFTWVGDIHRRFKTPYKAIALQAVWSSVLVFTGSYRALFTRVIYTEWIFFGLMAIGLIILRGKPHLTRQYSVPGYPFVPLIFAFAAFLIVIHHIVDQPIESAAGLSIVLVGLIVYFIINKQKKHGK